MQIFYLETNEEVPSIIDRIQKSDDSDIALVVPKGALLIQSIVNLKLVKRESDKLTKNLVVVTTDKIGRNLAAQVGITVYERIEKGKATGKVPAQEIINSSKESDIIDGIKIHRYNDADEPAVDHTTDKVDTQTVLIKEVDEFKPGGRSSKKRDNKIRRFVAKIILIAVVIMIVAGIGVGFWALPLTNISITLKAEDYSKELDVALSSSGTDGVKTTLLTAEKTASKSSDATGTKNIGEKAKGSLVLYNEYSSASQPLQSGTRIQSADGKVFRLDSDVVIPGGTFEVEGSTAKLKSAGTVNTTATADQAGEDYNIGASQLTVPGIGSSREDKIYAKTSGFAGGVSKTVKVVSVNDISDAKIDLTNQLTSEIQDEMTTKSATSALIQSSLQKNITSFSTSKKADEEASNFDSTGKMEMKVLAYNADELKTFIKTKVKADLAQNQDFILDEKNLSIAESEFNIDATTAKLHIKASGKVSDKLDQKALAQQLHGKSYTEANAIVGKLEQFTAVKITATPSWWFARIPNRSQSLELEIKYE